jgi:hypothetical protein
MSRLVEGKQPAASAYAGRSGKQAAADYGERVAKYVPAEIIAAYLALLPIVLGDAADGTTKRTTLLAIVFGACLVLTPLYLSRFVEAGKPKWMHLIVSTVAFVVWAYAIGGFFTDIGWYDKAAAAILITFFSLVSGLFVPTQTR